MLSIIVAKAKNNIIGKENKLVWHLPADLRHFKEITTGHVIIMGRKTFESLGKVLPNRKHIVFSQNPDFKVNDENVQVVHSMLEIQEYIENEEENFVIGGAMIYNLLMPHVTKMYVTQIEEEFEGDCFFPVINTETWREVSRQKGLKNEENNLDYDFVNYERIEQKK
ncbi:MAG: dihydrofolate reductase [Clostridia bacterium]|nr:dihydrofolate reductase [Clostridia bacterium]